MKKLISVLLALAIIFTSTVVEFPLMAVTVQAAGNGVQAKINELLKVYYNDTYFSVSGEACTSKNCKENCRLFNIEPEGLPRGKDICTVDANSCCAFARYAYSYIFGHDDHSKTTESKTTPVVGDFVKSIGPLGEHFWICAGSAGTNKYYAYESNFTVTNRVKYKASIYTQDQIVFVRHATNYDAVNNGTEVENAPYIGTPYTTAVGQTTASIKCDIAKNGSNWTTVGAYYGTSTSNMVSAGSDKLGTINSWASYDLTGLKPGTTYYYKFYIQTPSKTYESSVQSFKTTVPSGDQSALLTYNALDDGTYAVYCPDANRLDLKSIVIPSTYNGKTVSQIAAYAFNGCKNLTSVSIPSTIKSIGFDAFRSCSSLRSIYLPNSIEEIWDRAFMDCSSLKTITFPQKVTTIPYLGLAGCTALTTVSIKGDVTYISTESFLNCKNLTSVNIPDTVEYIRRNAFQNCTSLKSISIPVGVKTIYRGIILGSGVTDIYYGGSKAQWEQLVFEPENEDVLAATIHYAITTPDTVTGFTGTATENSIVLKWNKSANATSYKLQQSINGAWTTIASPTGTTYTVSGLNANTTYNFRIFARNESEQSAQTKLTVTTLAALPAAVTGFTGVPSENSIVLNWYKSANATSYKLQQSINGAWITIASPTGTTYTVSGLQANTTYNFRIFARNESGQSDQTKLTISTIGVPAAVTGFTGTATTNSIVLKWNKSANATAYKLQQSINGAWTTIASPTGTTYTVSGLKANTTYNFRIFARNESGQSDQTKLTVSTVGIPATVTGFTGTATTDSIVLKWNNSANATSYKLQQNINGAWTTIAYPTGTTYTVSGLNANTAYNFRIFARNDSGQSDQTKLTVSTVGIPADVTGFMGIAGSNSITLNWYASANASEYKLQQQINGEWQTIAMLSDTTFTVTGLNAKTTYNFRIFARNGSAQSAQTKLTVKTL